MACRGYAVVVLFALGCALGTLAVEDPDCESSVVSHLPSEGSTEKLTPDYIEGPWWKLPPEQAFDAWTKRPRVMQSIALLVNASHTIQEIDHLFATAKATRDQTDKQLIEESRSTIQTLQTELDKIAEVTRAYEKIRPTQSKIAFEVKEVLAPLLRDLSRLFLIDAEVRYPFAERLAVFTEDLQTTLRAKQDAECKLQPYLPADELQETLHKYDQIADGIKKKIDSEIKAAGDILNPNSKHIHDVTAKLTDSENKLDTLRGELKEAISVGAAYIPYQADVKTSVLENQNALLNSVLRATEIETKLETQLKEVREKEDAAIYHMGSLLTALLLPNDVPAQSAFEKPIAAQTVEQVHQPNNAAM